MSMEAFAISQAVGHELSQREAARDAGPGLAILLALFIGAAFLAIGTAMFFPVTFAIVAAAGFALFSIGDYLTHAIFERIDWIFVVVFGAISATALFFLFRLTVALETGLANHFSYRIARHLWRSLAVFALAFVVLTFAYRSAEIRAPLIWAGVLTLAFQAILFRNVERDPYVRMPIVAAFAGLVLLLGLVPISFALHHYATEVIVEKYGTSQEKRNYEAEKKLRILSAAKQCSLHMENFDDCNDKDTLYALANRWLLYHGPIPPPWILFRDFQGEPINPTAWKIFKAELRTFSDRGLPIGTAAERAIFDRELALIVNRWSVAENAFRIEIDESRPLSLVWPPPYLIWVKKTLEQPVPIPARKSFGVGSIRRN